MALDDNERRILYRNLINDPATQSETRKYSFNDWERKLLSDEKAIGKLAQFSVGRNWAIDENDFAERFVPELKAPPTPKPKPAPAQQFPVGIAAPESIKGAAPSVTDIGREMAFKPAVQQPIEPVEPVEPIGVMAPEPIVEPAPSVTEVAREMAFKPPVQPKMPKEEEMSPLETAGQKVMEFASGFNRALFKAPSSVVKTASELGVGVINMLGGDMQSEDAVLYSLADKYDKWLDTSEVAKKWIGKPEYTGLATDVGSGLGQIASMVAAGPQGASQALLKTPTVLKAVSQQMFSKPSLIAFSQVFNSEFENMKAKGESEQTAFNQGLTNALATSPLENLPLINLAERLNKTIGVKLARRVLNALQQGAEEGGQEAVQQVFSNLTNNQLVESEQNIVDWAQGIQPSAEAGGVVGLLIGGLANAKAARGYSKTSGLDKFSDNVVNNEIIQNAARDYQDNITKAEQQGRKPDSFNQKQLKKIAENPEAWVRDEIKYIQQTIESNKTLGLDSKVEENSLAKATSLLNQIKAEKKGMNEAAIAPAQEAVPVAPEAEVIAPEGGAPMPQRVKILGKDVNMYNDYIPSRPEDVEPDAMYIFNADSRDGIPPLLQDVAYANKRESNGVKTENWHASISGEDLLNLYPQKAASPNLIAAPEAAPVAEDIPFEEVPAETEDELAFLDEMRLTPEEDAARLAQEGIIPAAPVAPAEEVASEVVAAAPAPVTTKNVISKPATGKHSSPYKFETFELGANDKRGKSLGHGVYLAKPQESTASNFSNVSLKEGVSNFQDSVNSESEKKGYESYFNNPAVNVLREFGRKIITENGKVVMDVSGDIEQDVRAAAEEYNKKLGPIEKASEAKKKQYATEEDIKNAVEFAKKHQDKLGAAYEYEMEYETDGYIVPDTTSKVATLPKEILNAISSFSPEAKALVDAAAKNNKATFQDLYNNLIGVKGLDSPKGVSDFLDSKGVIGQNDNGQILIYNDKKVNVISRKEVSYAEKGRELKAPVKPAPAAPKKEQAPKPEPKKEEGKPAETKAETEFTSQQSSEAATAFDKTKTSKGFDKKYGKGAYKALSDITKNFEDIMDGMSGKIKQDCL